MRKFFAMLSFDRQLQKQVDRDPNLADAVVLALTMYKSRRARVRLAPNFEGWILGFKTKDEL